MTHDWQAMRWTGCFMDSFISTQKLSVQKTLQRKFKRAS